MKETKFIVSHVLCLNVPCTVSYRKGLLLLMYRTDGLALDKTRLVHLLLAVYNKHIPRLLRNA
jgi:hypothetical protein